ncbi:MAG: hypothetical protein K2Z81_25345 [Cyanobacteria bacterium]|nr:hypothetical protein [Cyanobacteriota bacterium]
MSFRLVPSIVICLILAGTSRAAWSRGTDFSDSPLLDSAVTGERTDAEMKKRERNRELRKKRWEDDERRDLEEKRLEKMTERHGDDERDKLRDAWTSSFTDTDFSERTYQDLHAVSEKGVEGDRDSDKKDKRDDSDPLKPDDDDGPKADRKDDRKPVPSLDDDDGDDDMLVPLDADVEEMRIFKDLTAPIPGMLQDWVPSKPDPISNGGFINEDGNGRPVPYRLNGHLDPERKLPWEADPD